MKSHFGIDRADAFFARHSQLLWFRQLSLPSESSMRRRAPEELVVPIRSWENAKDLRVGWDASPLDANAVMFLSRSP